MALSAARAWKRPCLHVACACDGHRAGGVPLRGSALMHSCTWAYACPSRASSTFAEAAAKCAGGRGCHRKLATFKFLHPRGRSRGPGTPAHRRRAHTCGASPDVAQSESSHSAAPIASLSHAFCLWPAKHRCSPHCRPRAHAHESHEQFWPFQLGVAEATSEHDGTYASGTGFETSARLSSATPCSRKHTA